MSNAIHHFAPTGARLRTGARCVLFLTFLLGFELTAIAQTAARPDRGLQPSGSYAVSDIESINLTVGNVNLSIPLASLPPIAGGKLSFTLNATYNSKLWDVTRYQVKQNEPPIYNYIVDTPQISSSGGWQLFGGYNIRFRDSHEDYDWAFPTSNESDFNYLVQHPYWHKRFVVTPDGAEHELRPLGYNPYSGARSYLWGYYDDSPDSLNQPISYYTIDGTYLWVKIYPMNHPSGINAEIYARDGTVVRFANGLQRIIDPNGNEIRIWSDTEATHYMDQQTAREIKVTTPSPGISRVSYQTVGGTWMHTDVVWGTTQVQRQTYWTHIPQEEGGDCENPTILYGVSIDVVREIIFPQTEPGQSGQRFSFSYNSDTTEAVNLNWWPSCEVFQPITSSSRGWGALKQMVTPSGAVVNYSFSLDSIHELVDPNEASRERITSKSVTHDAVTDTWNYGESSVTNPDGSVVTESAYPKDVAFPSTWGGATGLAGLVYRSNQSNKVMVERRWERKVFSGAIDNFTGIGMAVFNPVVVAEYTSLLDDSPSHNPVKMSARTYQYDYNGNILEEKDYDWFDPAQVQRDSFGIPTAVPAGATLSRTTSYSYYNQATSSSSSSVYAKRSLTSGTPLILNALQQSTLGPSVTQLSYDGQSYGVAPTAGNLTSRSVWDNFNNNWITTSNTYGLYGNLATSTDGRGKVIQYFYDDATHALPNRVVVDPQNGTGTQTTTTAYDFSTGLQISTTDPNGNTATIDYTNQLLGTVDPFGRPGITIGPDMGGGVNRRVKTIYEDNARTVTVLSDLNSEGDGLIKTQVLSDMMGRVIENRQFETATTFIAVRKTYDIPNRVSKTSNPFRAGETVNWTTTVTDLLGRVVSVTTPDNAVVLSSYNANSVTVTEQTGKQTKSVTDALGCLKEVYEAPNDQNYNYLTSYTYNALDNLVKVTQGSQQRFFMYDSLKRLIRSRNPEQGTLASLNLSDPISGNSAWSIGYEYDPNGNLTKKTDARGVYSTFVYDALNRNTSIDYSDTASINPDVKRFYDGATNGKGRFWYSYKGGDYNAGSNVEHTAVDSYDAAGRPLVQRQLFKLDGTWSPTYQISRGYNVAGLVISQTYPSGRSVSYVYDVAGRATSFSGNLGGNSRTYATNIFYSSWGSIGREQFGADTLLYHKRFYNIRGQLFDTRLSSVDDPWDWNRGRLINYYSSNHLWGQSGTDNNGNVRFAETWVPPANATLDQPDTLWEDAYTYDPLNRLISVAEQKTSVAGGWGSWTQQFRQQYTYDPYGNRTIDAAQTWGTGINNKQFTVDTATNRLGVPNQQTGVMTYDAAGNLINDTYTGAGAREYDAENRMTRAWGGNNQWQEYTYNADGQRTRRKVNNQETWQIYGIGGEQLAEYAAGGSPSTPQKEYGYRNGQLLVTAEPTAVRWLVTDHLGTPRMIVDQAGTLTSVKRHDYLPFGEELFAPIGGRSSSLGYASGDGVRQEFTQKERDVETGLDYFGARYYSSTQGRFTSSDSFGGSQLSPQSLNLYSYVQGNPLKFIDPTGNFGIDNSIDPFNCMLCQRQDPPQRPTATKPNVKVPEGYEIKPDGSLVKTGGGPVVNESVNVKIPRPSRLKRAARALGWGPIMGALQVFLGEMIDPDPVGGADADLGPNDVGFAMDYQNTFMDGRFTPERLDHDEVFYRVYSDPARMQGRFLTATYFTNSQEAIRMLALSPKITPNKATHIVAVVVPAGTVIARGYTAPVDPKDKYPGGGSQVIIPNQFDPRIRWVYPHPIGK
jgi:RHS repeat-associated protein